ncbi:hypothetical protein GA0070624_0960 [Micromonospora rhizosphaerae]|uniref:Uncharacterized protein n=1 Tax=Micromonospora rhizosphaerae TaxID=568872 RepID=A0A1C6RGI4_9ACTN|nr:hypothetical protein [Micromonospora rhizosphaerae]SCL16229.1 hypothetical protein GA0070624_0960 [Micromonospora rhizosphaerae]
MYGWIWRKLPFGLAGKLTGSVLIAAAAVALLWFVVFPWAEPLLPFDDVQVTQDSGVPGDTGGQTGDSGPAGDEPTGDPHELPYSTHSNNAPPPTGSR